MNWLFFIAGGLALAATPIHLQGGEWTLRKIPSAHFPTTAQGDGIIAKQEIRMVWHMATIDLLFGGVLLLLLAATDILPEPTLLARFIAVYFVGYGLVIALLPMFTLHRFDTLARLPQWILCFAIALFAFGGTL